MLVIGAALMLRAPSAQAGLVIDDFTSTAATWPVSMNNPNVIPVFESGLQDVLGGTRVTTLSGHAFDIKGVDQIRANIVPKFGVLDYASSVGGDGDLRLAYVGGFKTDLSADAFIQIDFTGYDVGMGVPMPVTATLGTGAKTASLTHLLQGTGPQSLIFNFAEFSDIQAINLAGITAMEFYFDPAAGGDFRIDRIASVVPEPTTLIMLLAGAGAIFFRRRPHT